MAFAACGGESEHTVVGERVSNDQALALIRACEITRLLGLHSGEMELTVEGGRRAFVRRPDTAALNKAANASMERGCDMAVGME